jgi:hypothetical protein
MFALSTYRLGGIHCNEGVAGGRAFAASMRAKAFITASELG